MIAYSTPVCYSVHMRKMVVGALILLSVIIVYSSGLLSELGFFLIAGKIPFSTIFIPATAMMIFWIVVVPLSLLFRASIVALFWAIVEKAGHFNQRRLNQQIHRSIIDKQFAPILHLYTIVLLRAPNYTDTNSTEKIALRRRFIALQM